MAFLLVGRCCGGHILPKVHGYVVSKRHPTFRLAQEFLERAFDAIGVKPK